MGSLQGHARLLFRNAAFLVMVASLSACGDSRSLKWTEDVPLSDGRVVTLTRYQEFKGPHEIGQPPTESDYWFEFRHPDTGKVVRWRSDRDLATRALLIDEGVPRLLVTPNFGGIYRRNCPNPPYLLFRFASGQWQEESIEHLRGRRIRPNMTYSAFGARDEIRSSDYRLSKEQVLSRQRGFVKGSEIDFARLTVQTFGIGRGCSPPYNWLIDQKES